MYTHPWPVPRNREEDMRSFVINILVPDYSKVFADKIQNNSHLATITAVCELLVFKKIFRHETDTNFENFLLFYAIYK